VASKPAESKHARIRQTLTDQIASGRYDAGQRLPSEAELVRTFGVSRPTVNRVLRELQLAGLIDRRAGSGSYVRADAAAHGYVFGLLIPELGRTEIFEPICRGMADAQHGSQHVLLWGTSLTEGANIEEQAAQACRQLVARKVSGVFFAPLELTPEKDAINRRIAKVLDRAGIPVVLLDRDLVPYPSRSPYDLVGIDNRRAGYVLATHLIQRGCRRVVFVGRPGSAPTVDARIGGYKEALNAAGLTPHVCRIDPADRGQVKDALRKPRPDGFVCANDFTAAQLLRTLDNLKVSVPQDVRLVGVDDVKYASLFPVPLTTVHQPCAEIGTMAIAAMLERLSHPKMPPRDVLLDFRLVVRASCGSSDR
jgi:DNA-binding LacI/PurR family transcriptional regulator